MLFRATAIGHSHSANLADAVRAAGAPVDVLNFWTLPGAVTQHAGHAELSAGVIARLVPPGPALPVFSLIGGAVHHDVGLIEHPEKFDFVDPDFPDEPLSPGARIIPLRAVEAALHARALPYLRIMDAVRRAAPGPVYHLQSPPIFADETLQGADLDYWTALYGYAPRVAPAPARRRLWRLHSAIVRRHCAAQGIIWVPCPPAAFDAAGYLRAGLNAHAAHANAAYGALLLRQVLDLAPPAPALALPSAGP